MSTLNATDHEQAPIDSPRNGLRQRIGEWWHRQASVTNGHLLGSRIIWVLVVTLGIWGTIRTVQLDNRVTRERVDTAVAADQRACDIRNDTRAKAKVIALGDIANARQSIVADRSVWDDGVEPLFPDGLPVSLRSVVDGAFAAREAAINVQAELIEVTYVDEDCPGTF